MCGTNGTCAPSFCATLGSRFTYYAAAVELNAICNGYNDSNGNNWTFEGCTPDHYKGIPGLLDYARTIYCGIAQCAVEGGTYGSCYCQWYDFLCQTYGDERRYIVSQKMRLYLCHSL